MAKTVDVTVDTRYVLWYNSDSKLKQDRTEKIETESEKTQTNTDTVFRVAITIGKTPLNVKENMGEHQTID